MAHDSAQTVNVRKILLQRQGKTSIDEVLLEINPDANRGKTEKLWGPEVTSAQVLCCTAEPLSLPLDGKPVTCGGCSYQYRFDNADGKQVVRYEHGRRKTEALLRSNGYRAGYNQ